MTKSIILYFLVVDRFGCCCDWQFFFLYSSDTKHFSKKKNCKSFGYNKISVYTINERKFDFSICSLLMVCFNDIISHFFIALFMNRRVDEYLFWIVVKKGKFFFFKLKSISICLASVYCFAFQKIHYKCFEIKTNL